LGISERPAVGGLALRNSKSVDVIAFSAPWRLQSRVIASIIFQNHSSFPNAKCPSWC